MSDRGWGCRWNCETSFGARSSGSKGDVMVRGIRPRAAMPSAPLSGIGMMTGISHKEVNSWSMLGQRVLIAERHPYLPDALSQMAVTLACVQSTSEQLQGSVCRTGAGFVGVALPIDLLHNPIGVFLQALVRFGPGRRQARGRHGPGDKHRVVHLWPVPFHGVTVRLRGRKPI